MRERLMTMLGPVARAIWILTFHSACGRILRKEAERLGYRSNFTIYDSADQVRLVKQCLEELEKDPKRFVPRGVHAQISNAKNQLVTPAMYAERISSFYDQTIAEAYELYQRKLAASNAVDFDDMLMLTVQILENFPDARKHWQNAFRYVLVDEYQDTNHAQYRLLQLLAEHHHNICAVGRPRSVDFCVQRSGHPQHPRVRARLPRDAHDSARAELPLDERDPRGRELRHREQLRAKGEAALVGARRRRSGARDRGRGRAGGGALRRRPDRRARRGGILRQRNRDLLPDERAVASARADAASAPDRLPGDRRPSLLRARRDQGRDGLSPGTRQPGGRRQPDEDREPAEAGDRRHDDLTARRLCRKPRADALRRARPADGSGPRYGCGEGGHRSQEPARLAPLGGAGARGA